MSPTHAFLIGLASLAITLFPACAAPIQRPVVRPVASAAPPSRAVAGSNRPLVGVAFGGGSARGIAHVGVIRWLEEHRVPIDVAAGTSMGGLIGGAFATGMDATELEAFIASLDWNQLFGASSFEYKNIRRKADARAYPSRLEFGLKGGIVPPSALNSGEYVELLLGRIAAPYFDIDSFDELPTPFRTVAVDLLSAQPVVLRTGSLADAMRATMSLPLIFPPVELDGRILIDGGTMNNVPADIARQMGADRVIAISVGDLSNREGVTASMFGVAGDTIDAMMRASTNRIIATADVVVSVPTAGFSPLDWRRAAGLIEAGYAAAEAMRDELLPLSVSESEFAAWRRSRQARRRTSLPAPAFIELDGFGAGEATRLNALLARHLGTPVDIAAIDRDIAEIAGLDRYETVTWQLRGDPGRGVGLRVRGRLKSFAPPFVMLGVNMENTTATDFRIAAAVRYLAFDSVGPGSELRLDATLGSDPSLAAELYRPLGSTPLFVAPYAGIGKLTFNVIDNDAVIARYRRRLARAGVNAGVNLGAHSDVRIGAYLGRSTASIQIGDPGFPELRGRDTGAELRWRVDTQDSPIVPSRGVASEVVLSRIFESPAVTIAGEAFDRSPSVTQLSVSGNRFWSVGARHRIFTLGGIGTSFDSTPLPTNQFGLGAPLRLGAYNAGELRGNRYYVATAGYMRQVGQLPDFLGGPVFAGGWLDNGDAFDEWTAARWRTNAGVGIVMDTIAGPVLLAGSWGFDGRWRSYLGVGRIFR